MKNKFLSILFLNFLLVTSSALPTFAKEVVVSKTSDMSISTNSSINSRAFSRVYTPELNSDDYSKIMSDSNTFPNDKVIRVYLEDSKNQKISIKVVEHKSGNSNNSYYKIIDQGETAEFHLEKGGNSFTIYGQAISIDKSVTPKIVVMLGSE